MHTCTRYLPKRKACLCFYFIQILTTLWSARFASKANKLERHIARCDVRKTVLLFLLLEEAI